MVVMVVLALSLAACATGTDPTDSPTDAPDPTATDPEATETPEPEPEDDYPEEAVTLVIGFGAGGALDLVGRAVASAIDECWDQPLTILNQEGAGGTIAASEVVQAEPDGYTSYLAPVAAMAAQPHRTGAEVGYEGPDDYQPVINLLYFPQVLAVNADAPYDTIEEFIAYAEENPGEITVGSGGEGTLPHLTLEALKSEADIDLTHVPFQGFSESVPAVLGGHVAGIIVTPADMVPHVEAGTAKIIGVFSGDRIDTFPDSPTFREAGVDFVQDNYYFVFVPKDTPENRVMAYHDALECVLETDSFQEFAEGSGAVIDYKGPDETREQVQEDYERFGDIIPQLGL